MMPGIKEASDLKGDDFVELSTENDSLENKIGSFDENWIEESQAKLLKQFKDKKEKQN